MANVKDSVTMKDSVSVQLIRTPSPSKPRCPKCGGVDTVVPFKSAQVEVYVNKSLVEEVHLCAACRVQFMDVKSRFTM